MEIKYFKQELRKALSGWSIEFYIWNKKELDEEFGLFLINAISFLIDNLLKIPAMQKIIKQKKIELTLYFSPGALPLKSIKDILLIIKDNQLELQLSIGWIDDFTKKARKKFKAYTKLIKNTLNILQELKDVYAIELSKYEFLLNINPEKNRYYGINIEIKDLPFLLKNNQYIQDFLQDFLQESKNIGEIVKKWSFTNYAFSCAFPHYIGKTKKLAVLSRYLELEKQKSIALKLKVFFIDDLDTLSYFVLSQLLKKQLPDSCKIILKELNLKIDNFTIFYEILINNEVFNKAIKALLPLSNQFKEGTLYFIDNLPNLHPNLAKVLKSIIIHKESLFNKQVDIDKEENTTTALTHFQEMLKQLKFIFTLNNYLRSCY